MSVYTHWFFDNYVPMEQRFANMSAAHFIYMAIGAAIVVALAVWARKNAGPRVGRVIRGLCFGLLMFYFIRSFLYFLFFPNFTFLDILPVHMCAIAGFVIPAAVFLRNRVLLNLSYAILVPGALFAIVTPESTVSIFHAFGWLPIIYFIWHFWIILIPVMLVAGKELVPDIRTYPWVMLILVGYSAVVYVINVLLGTNYMFLGRPARGTILEPLGNWLGNPGYLLPLAFIAFSITFLMFLPWYLSAKKRGKNDD